MKILLINASPVVSRLLALCTRDAHLSLDEVRSVDEIGDVAYDLIFVDDGSYIDTVDTFLDEGEQRKKVFISYMKEAVKGFDEIIHKPFLPSQITQIIDSMQSVKTVDEHREKHAIFPLASEDVSVEKESELSISSLDREDESTEEVLEVISDSVMQEEDFESSEALPLEVLDSNEIEKIKALLDMGDEDASIGNLSEDEVHIRKVEVIKEELTSKGLEILDEDEIFDVLSTRKKEKQHKGQKKKETTSHCSKETLLELETAIAKALTSLKPKKIKKFLKGKEIELKIKLKDND